jgi:outer membrane protein assembly factor BamB
LTFPGRFSARSLPVFLALVVILCATAEDWPTYMRDPSRGALSQETWLSTANAASLQKLWAFNTGDLVAASPTIVNNIVYVGSWNGYEYAINAATGAQIWKTFLGTTTPAPDCSPDRTIGVTSAATVQNGVVYVGGGDDYWYALNASNGSVLWKIYIGDSSTTGGNYNWSSPLIYGNNAYIGVASFGDCPLVQGKVLKVSLTTHAVVGTFNVVPDGTLGGGIWSSPTIDAATGIIYITTGTRPLQSQVLAQAIVAINSSDMSLAGSWAIAFPQSEISDADFGTTPTLVQESNGTNLIVAANKNGLAYALSRTNLGAGPVWQTTVADGGSSPQYGDGTISSGVFTNGTLYYAGGRVTVNGTMHPGSVDAIDPNNGSFIWRHYTANAVIPALASIDGLILAAAGPTLEVLNAANGTPLYSFATSADIYSAPSVSNGRIFFGSGDGNVYALGLGAPGTPTPTATATSIPAPGPVSSLFNNAGTVYDGAAAPSNLDGYGFAYSEQALAAAGVKEGGTVTAGGVQFTWPNVPPGKPDNVVPGGQTVLLSAPTGGATLGFLGSSTSGPSGGMATINFTDGSRQHFTLAFSDWTLGPKGTEQPLSGNTSAASMSYRDTSAGAPNVLSTYVFFDGVTLPPGKTVQSVTLPSSVTGGPLHIFAVAVAGAGTASTSTPTPTNTPVTSMGGLPFNNAGSVADGVSSDSNLDGYGFAYSVQALAAAGITPGGTVTAGGLSFTWPAVQPGGPDNVEVAGQVVSLAPHPGATTLGFLGTATTGPSGGAGVITYTDGSIQNFQLTFSDWALGGPAHAAPVVGTTIVASMPYRDTASGARDATPVYVFFTSIRLNAAKTVARVTLPSVVNAGPVHVFGLTVGTPGPALTNTPTVTPTSTATPTGTPTQAASSTNSLPFTNSGTTSDGTPGGANLDGYGYSYSAQALAVAGISRGKPFTTNGLTFTWPVSAPGSPDNVVPAGQRLAFSPPLTGTTLAFLGCSTSGPSGGTATITYSDGTTQNFSLAFSDWALGGNSNGAPIAGNAIVARMGYRDTQSGAQNALAVFLFYTGVTLAPGKSLSGVTLPASVNGGPLHIFAMTVGTPGASQPTTPTSTATATLPPQATSTSTATQRATSTPTATLTATSTSTATPPVTSTPTATPSVTSTSTATLPATSTPTAVATGGGSPVLPFDNIGISSNGTSSSANLDGYGFSYSTQALAAGGLVAGQKVTAGGQTFTWPAELAGQPDNVEPHGQTLTFSPAATGATLGFLGSSTSGPSGGTATIQYTDGSTQSFTLAFSDWALGGGKSGAPIPGNSIVASMSYRNNQSGAADPVGVYVFYAGIGLTPGKRVSSVTLPSSLNGGPLHIFAVTIS